MKKISILFIATFITSFVYCQKADEIAIKKLLEKESATWRAADVKGHAACWVIKPYSRILVSTTDNKVLDIPPDYMVNPPLGKLGNGGSSINSNYKMHISGNNAWVSHDELSTTLDGTKNYSYEIRILEKIKGQWKLVAQSIHLYQPK